MPTHQEMKDQARAMAQSILSSSPSFRNLERSEQMELYKDMVNTNYQALAQQYGLLSEQSGLATAMRNDDKATDYLDKDAADPRGLARAGGQEMADTMNRVDFPKFVRDLLVGVFQANMDATDRQQQAFVKLLREVNKDVNEIIKTQVNAQEALGRLIQNDPRFKNKKYEVIPRGKLKLKQSKSKDTNADPNLPVLVEQGKHDKEIDAKLQESFQDLLKKMAEEYRGLLREMLLMGVNRMVVDKGIVRATAKFKVETNANNKLTQSSTVSTNKNERESGFFYGGGFFGGGFAVGGYDQSSSITIEADSSADLDSDKSIKSENEVTGFVEINFKSDYFKMDNFLQIMDLGKGQIAQGPPGAKPPVTQGAGAPPTPPALPPTPPTDAPPAQ